MSDAKSNQEPSMEEILASIRKIISEDGDAESRFTPKADPAPAAPKPGLRTVPKEEPPPVLELTQMLQDDGSVVELRQREPDPPPAPAREPEPEPVVTSEEDEPAPITMGDWAMPSDPEPVTDVAGLVSSATEELASNAFKNLAQTLSAPAAAPAPASTSSVGGLTVEDLVRELLKPMLREWLDQNLPGMVERLVQQEIRRMVERAQTGR